MELDILIRQPKPKGYILTYKQILVIKYRIFMLHSTDPKNIKKKKGPSKNS